MCPTATPGSPNTIPPLALLPIGYADGVFRNLSGRMDVLINGRLRPITGRVCMDQLVVDVGSDGDVSEGDDAILFGPGTQGESHRAGLGRTARHHQLRSRYEPSRPRRTDLPRNPTEGQSR